MPDLSNEYATRFASILVPLAERLEQYLGKIVIVRPRIDRVRVRAKTVDSFLRKAAKTDPAGAPKYAEPLDEIQDQVAARIITFYLSDVDKVQTLVEGYFGPIEKRRVEPESHSEFGYEGFHYVLFLPDDVFGADISQAAAPKFFELQIKTLFQHAWSESAHDLIYKPNVK